jgi:hypothetical protein
MAIGGYLSYLRAQSNFLADLTSHISQTQERLEANLQQSLWVYDATFSYVHSAVDSTFNPTPFLQPKVYAAAVM